MATDFYFLFSLKLLIPFGTTKNTKKKKKAKTA